MAYYRKRGKTWRVEVERNGIRESETFPSKGAAQAWAAKREAEIMDGDRASVPNLRMSDLFSRYAKEVSPAKKGAKWEKVRLDLLGRDRIAQVRLRDLSAAHLSDWQKRRLEAVSGASVRRERNLLNNALEIARKEWGWLKVNPFERIRRPKDGAPKERVATDAEISSILENASIQMARVIRFALETGMRASEIAHLAATDIDGQIAILRDTKNGTKREVPLSEKAIEILQSIPSQHLGSSEALPRNAPDEPCHGETRNGSVALRRGTGGGVTQVGREERLPVFGLTAGSISALFARYAKEAKVDGLTFHCLRRTAATRLSERLTVLELCAMFGWKDPRIVVKHYYKADPEAIARKLNAP